MPRTSDTFRNGPAISRAQPQVVSQFVTPAHRHHTGRLQAFVHDGDGDIELIDDIGGDATVLRLADDAGNPNVGPGTRHVAVVTDRRSDVRNDDPLNWRHGSPGVELSRRAN